MTSWTAAWFPKVCVPASNVASKPALSRFPSLPGLVSPLAGPLYPEIALRKPPPGGLSGEGRRHAAPPRELIFTCPVSGVSIGAASSGRGSGGYTGRFVRPALPPDL